MDGLFQEMLGASNVDIDTNVDIVFAIDATESMQPLIDKVKSLTLSFREELEKGLKENRRIIKNLRIKVIVFRDYYRSVYRCFGASLRAAGRWGSQ